MLNGCTSYINCSMPAAQGQERSGKVEGKSNQQPTYRSPAENPNQTYSSPAERTPSQIYNSPAENPKIGKQQPTREPQGRNTTAY